MSNEEPLSARAVLQRLAAVVGAKNDTELARTMGVARSTINTWTNRDSVPYSICIKFALNEKISLDWLLTGEGDRQKAHTTESKLNESLLEEVLGALEEALTCTGKAMRPSYKAKVAVALYCMYSEGENKGIVDKKAVLTLVKSAA